MGRLQNGLLVRPSQRVLITDDFHLFNQDVASGLYVV